MHSSAYYTPARPVRSSACCKALRMAIADKRLAKGCVVRSRALAEPETARFCSLCATLAKRQMILKLFRPIPT